MDKREFIKKLKEFKKNLREKYNVDKIILFGSRASGKYKKDSDVDLIVVGKFKGKSNLERVPALHLEWNIDLPVDILCYTPREFDRLKDRITIVRDAVREGIEI